jgi:glycosyltransferase involved in cell wall biosynthesis
LRILAIVHGLWRGGAQEATLEILKLLKTREIEISILISDSAERTFRSEIEHLGIATFTTRGKLVAHYPDLAAEDHAELIKSSDLVWITDVEYLVAPRIKSIKKDVPIIAHLHSYALACPITSAFYGMRETCTVNCSHSLRRFAQCRQGWKQYVARWHQNRTRMKVYQLLNFPKSYLDFRAWPMNEGIVESIDGFVTVSNYTRDLMRIHLPQLNHVPVEVIPNPVIVPEPDSPKNHQEGEKRTILYASGSNISKGPQIVLYAARKLLDESSKKFTLTMLSMEDNVWIKNIVKRLRIENYVKLLERLPSRKQVFALMADSTVVVLPSLWPEPLATVPIEANLLGTPAIVSNRGGNPDTIVDKVTGLVTEPAVDTVAKALKEGLQHNWDRKSIARIAKERFNPERTTDSLVNFLESFV